jgi:hypothetical protein
MEKIKMNNAKIKLNMIKFAEILDKEELYDLSDTMIHIATIKKPKDKIEEKQMQALYAFMAWLTTRKEEAGPFSEKHEAPEAIELITEFCKSQGWDDSGKDWGNWIKNFKPYPKDKKRKKTAGTTEDENKYCDECEISDEEDGAYIDYNEWADKDLCQDCQFN